MPEEWAISAVIISRRKQEDYVAKQYKLYMWFVYQKNHLANFQGNPGVLFGAAMSLYKGEKTKVNFYHIYLKSMR